MRGFGMPIQNGRAEILIRSNRYTERRVWLGRANSSHWSLVTTASCKHDRPNPRIFAPRPQNEETFSGASRLGLKRVYAETQMARKPGTRTNAEFVLFDVFYEDGTQRSNRKVPTSALGGLDGGEPARAIIEEQDRAIAEKSGAPPGRIKSIRRAGAK